MGDYSMRILGGEKGEKGHTFLGFCFVPFRSRPPAPVYVKASPYSISL